MTSNVVPLRRFHVLGWDAIAAPLPEIPWMNELLNLSTGRPFMFCGEAGTKKSWWGQSLLVHGAADLPFLGRFEWKKSGVKCLYIDYEQGERESRLRFQQLAGGLQIGVSKLGGRLGYSWQPIEFWNPKERDRKRVIDDVCHLVDGYDIAIVDSLLDCQPGADENSSEIVTAAKIATTASEKTGCALGFIDHVSNKGQGTSRGNAQRGHSAKKGASSVLFVASGHSPDPVTVTCERSQNVSYDKRAPTYGYDLFNAAGGVVVREVALLSKDKPAPEIALRTLATALRSMVQANEGASFDELRKLLAVRAEDLRAARDFLLRQPDGIENRGSAGKPAWYLRSGDTDANGGAPF